MKLTWVNHASFMLSDGPVTLITDPWIEGSVFFKGWSLISDSVFTYDDFKSITHIWFSHEHPDHFNPEVLKKIPLEFRQTLTILFQETTDKQVISFCKKIGFEHIIELKPGQWTSLSDSFQIVCHPDKPGSIDSWSAFKINEKLILNLNDCVIHSETEFQFIETILNKQPIDILLTQFSYAQWEGNPNEVQKRQAAAAKKKTTVHNQCDFFKPRFIIPFASFVYFSNANNFYMNDAINTIDQVVTEIKQKGTAQVVVMYPGDEWNGQNTFETKIAVKRYTEDLAQKIAKGPVLRFEKIPLDTLFESALQFSKTLKKTNSGLLFLLFQWTVLRSFTAYLSDYKQAFRFTLNKGLRPIKLDQKQCDVVLPSEFLKFCFEKPWGGETLEINGSFQKPPEGNFSHFHRFFRLFRLNSLHFKLSGLVLFWSKKALKKVFSTRSQDAEL